MDLLHSFSIAYYHLRAIIDVNVGVLINIPFICCNCQFTAEYKDVWTVERKWNSKHELKPHFTKRPGLLYKQHLCIYSQYLKIILFVTIQLVLASSIQPKGCFACSSSGISQSNN